MKKEEGGPMARPKRGGANRPDSEDTDRLGEESTRVNNDGLPSDTPHAGPGAGDDPPQRPKSWRGPDGRTNSARIRTLTELNDLADALTRELLRRRFTATELKLFLFVLVETLNRCGRWVTVHGGIKSLAAQFVTHPEEVRSALAHLTDQISGKILWADRSGRKLRLRINPAPEQWGADFQPLITDDERRALRRRVVVDEEDLQLIMDTILQPNLDDVLPDTVLSHVLARLGEGEDVPQSGPLAQGMSAGAEHPLLVSGGCGPVIPKGAEVPPQGMSTGAEHPPLDGAGCAAVLPKGAEVPPQRRALLRSFEDCQGSKASKTLKHGSAQTIQSSFERYVQKADQAFQIADEDLRAVPLFTGHAHFVAWLGALEQKFGGWMGDSRPGMTWRESFGGQWWARWKENSAKFRTVWNEVLSMQREGKIANSLGGAADDLWANNRL